MADTGWLAETCEDCPHANGDHGPDGCSKCDCPWALTRRDRKAIEAAGA